MNMCPYSWPVMFDCHMVPSGNQTMASLMIFPARNLPAYKGFFFPAGHMFDSQMVNKPIKHWDL